MELCAADETCQSYGKIIIKVVGKKESVEGMQERHEVFKSEQIHLKTAYLMEERKAVGSREEALVSTKFWTSWRMAKESHGKIGHCFLYGGEKNITVRLY